MTRPPPSSTLFPYTTLFRSERDQRDQRERATQHHSGGQTVVNIREPDEGSDQEKNHRGGGGRGGDDRQHQDPPADARSEEHTSELQSRQYLVCRLLLEKKNN